MFHSFNQPKSLLHSSAIYTGPLHWGKGNTAKGIHNCHHVTIWHSTWLGFNKEWFKAWTSQWQEHEAFSPWARYTWFQQLLGLNPNSSTAQVPGEEKNQERKILLLYDSSVLISAWEAYIRILSSNQVKLAAVSITAVTAEYLNACLCLILV